MYLIHVVEAHVTDHGRRPASKVGRALVCAVAKEHLHDLHLAVEAAAVERGPVAVPLVERGVRKAEKGVQTVEKGLVQKGKKKINILTYIHLVGNCRMRKVVPLRLLEGFMRERWHKLLKSDKLGGNCCIPRRKRLLLYFHFHM